MDKSTEISLVAGLKARDENAFEQLVQCYGRRLFAIAQRLLRNEEDARDVVQDTLLSAFRAIEAFEGHAKFSTWLHRIASNAALMKLRSQRRKREESLDAKLSLEPFHLAHMGSDWEEPPDLMMQRQETCTLVHACIADLPDPYRTVVWLRDIEDLDTAETARRLGASPIAVKLRLHRARRALRNLLSARLAETPL